MLATDTSCNSFARWPPLLTLVVGLLLRAQAPRLGGTLNLGSLFVSALHIPVSQHKTSKYDNTHTKSTALNIYNDVGVDFGRISVDKVLVNNLDIQYKGPLGNVSSPTSSTSTTAAATSSASI